MESFEYAVKKDVRNNPIVREVDETRQRELWMSVGIAGFLVVAFLFSAWQHFELLRHGYQIEEMQRQRAAEEEIHGFVPIVDQGTADHEADEELVADGGPVERLMRGVREHKNDEGAHNTSDEREQQRSER